MNDNSDYNKPRTNLFSLLPDVYQSDTNKSVFENLFNRFLTKQETERVSGYIGKGNPSAIANRQLQEPTVHRQGYQLQPTLYNKIGSVEWISSWQDLIKEAERAGIDTENMQEWLDLLKFNWVPPIDIDKLIHYKNYYWYDEDNPTSTPQYSTIRSRCSTYTAQANFRQQLVDEYGLTIPVVRYESVTDYASSYNVIDIVAINDSIVVDGDATTELTSSSFFNVSGTAYNNAEYQATSLLYDVALDRTTITVTPGSITTSETSIGKLNIQRFDKLVVTGEFDRLFDSGFVFMYKQSSNTEINNTFLKVVSSELHSNETIITVDVVFTDSTADGVISQEEMLDAAIAAKDCQCTGSVGWDILHWDDNPNNPLWDNDHATLLASITQQTPPSAPGTVGELWWDTTADILYQYNPATNWVPLWNKFSTLTNTTTGTAFWEYVPGCGVSTVISAADQWIDQNKWFHKSDIPNFSIAKQAQLPIIEFDWDLELNEWNKATNQWKYRDSAQSSFVASTVSPNLIELFPFELWSQTNETIVLDETYGDLTSYFVPGRQLVGTGIPEIFEVLYSEYKSTSVGSVRSTVITLTVPVTGSGLVPATTGVPSSTPLRPTTTATGDAWKGYDTHWVYAGQSPAVPVAHQPLNDLMETSPMFPTPVHPSGHYSYNYTYYGQESTILVEKTPTFAGVRRIELSSGALPDTDTLLTERALIGTDSVRVYVNDIRQYGNYDELSLSDLSPQPNNLDTTKVAGISFLQGSELDKFDVVRIEVGPAAISDIGLACVNVRMIEDDIEFNNQGNPLTQVSLLEYRKSEQVKTASNQYPLFDMYNVDGTPAFAATPIFGFHSTPTSDINPAFGDRISTATDSLDYEFRQYLLNPADSSMYAYRDYSNQTNDFWVNDSTNEVFFWNGYGWSNKTFVGNYYTAAFVGNQSPSGYHSSVIGMYWYDTLSKELKRSTSVSPLEWEVLDPIVSSADPTLQTIWKHGSNKETYQIDKTDWKTRSRVEYEAEKQQHISETSAQYVAAGDTAQEANTKATSDWYASQRNHLSLDGEWVGDWEIPDPLYYNVSHENREVLSFKELLTHFDSIVQAQPKIPGFSGPRENMFHLIPTGSVNFGLGGKIREYNHGFDTLLSALFVDAASPTKLYEFAHDQYEALLNNIVEILRKDAVDLLQVHTPKSIEDQYGFISSSVISSHEQNDHLSLFYGDSTTFSDNTDQPDSGIRNWIATLPYMRVLDPVAPLLLRDGNNITAVSHHDGHLSSYTLTSPSINGIIESVITAPDNRTRYPGPSDPALDTFGRTSVDLPPSTVHDFSIVFNTTIHDRQGVYWNHSTTGTLYRLNILSAGVTEPSVSSVDGSLWLDLTPSQEILRIKQTDSNSGITSWEPVSGLTPGASSIKLHNGTTIEDATITAWQVVDIDAILNNTILNVEQLLFDNVPRISEKSYDIMALDGLSPSKTQSLLERAFLNYVTRNGISAPYENYGFDSTDPFTWNYKYSSPGQSFNIIASDANTNTFTMSGNVTVTFGLGVNFYVKNSGIDDGHWLTDPTIPSYFDGTNTVVYVTNRNVSNSASGLAYTGQLPSPYDPITRPYNTNDGSESGGAWQDLYQKLYNTPYPHIEPWKLQGYVSKPTWWDTAYANDDVAKWGTRRWKYRHGFDILSASSVDNSFQISGDFREIFTPTHRFEIIDSLGTNDGNWDMSNYSAILNVIVGSAGNARLEISGDHTQVFVSGVKIAVADTSGNLVSLFSVSGSTFTGPPSNSTIIGINEEITTTTGIDYITGAVYSSIDNSTKLYIDTASTTPNTETSVQSTNASGRITDRVGMWEKIRIGNIPPNVEYPSGIVSVTGNPILDNVSPLPTYGYFSVNITNDGVMGSIPPDGILPPYWDYAAHFGNAVVPLIDQPVRSVFSLFGEIVSPGANYAFGDAGPVEWTWRNSSQYLYDHMTISFQIDPVRFFFSTFGPATHTVGGLIVDSRTGRVMTHRDTLFHGDIDGNLLVQYDGTNQWYVNYARYSEIDITSSDFRSQWTEWTSPMSYQFSSFIDTQSFDLSHRYVSITDFDYNITSKRSPGVSDYWIESFQATILNMPPKIVRYDNDYDWEVELRTKSLSSHDNEYYDVRNYQFSADDQTSICSLYKWPVKSVSININTISILGDQTRIVSGSSEISITESTANDGTYTIQSSVYDAIANETIITLNEDIPSYISDGKLQLHYRTLPWSTGDLVTLTTHETLPIPLQSDNSNGLYLYFIIVLDDYNFRLALTAADAAAGVYVTLNTTGIGDHFVGQVATTFNTNNTPTNWRHYVIDNRHKLNLVSPYNVRGLQTVINIIDGYSQVLKELGWVINSDGSLKDANDHSKLVGWQTEVERFLEYSHSLRDVRHKVPQQYEVEVDVATNIWSFVGNSNSHFITGDPVTVYVSDNVYPSPLSRGGRYYIIRDSLSDFRLAATKANALSGTPIDITSGGGLGTICLAVASTLTLNKPTFEINPFRNGIWFRPEQGIVSNVINGPTNNVATSQLMLDQYARPLSNNNIQVFREDKETGIRVLDGIANDIALSSVFDDPYNFLHLSSMHLFLDTYEHIVIFDNNTTEGQLLYDPFIGLNVTKFELLFNRQVEFTQRPNVGGQYAITEFNQRTDLRRNIESSIEDIRLLYDTYSSIESNTLITNARKTIGYEGSDSHLANINLNEKSQFVFWKGKIQNKGSLNSMAAFVNSRRFIDAKLDEFWAVKIAEYGSSAEREYISMWLSTADARTNNLKLQFVSDDDLCHPGYSIDSFGKEPCGYAFPNDGFPAFVGDPEFTLISLSDTNRWYNQPDQLAKLRDNGGLMYFELTPFSKISVHIATSPPANPTKESGWVDTSNPSNYVFKTYNGNGWNENGNWDPVVGDVYLRHNTSSDFTSITLNIYEEGHRFSPIVPTSPTMREVTIDPYIPFANSLRVFKDGIQLDPVVDYAETIVTGQLLSSSIIFSDSVVGSDIEVIYKTSELSEDIHYKRINSNIVRLNFPETIDPSITNMTLWNWIIDKDVVNPAKIIDVETDTVVTPVQVWDPARGFHYSTAQHSIDLVNDEDPAIYSNTPRATQSPALIDGIDVVYNDAWNQNEVGTTWMDSKDVDYVPYFDSKAFDNSSERLRLWGQLSSWSDLTIYSWVESDVHPSEWDELAAIESSDSSIPEDIRKSGIARYTLFEKDPSTQEWKVMSSTYDEFDALIEGNGAGDLICNLATIVPENLAIDSASASDSAFILSSDITHKLAPTMEILITGTTLNNGTYDVISVTYDGSKSIVVVNATVNDEVVNGTLSVYRPVDVYVNGQTITNNQYVPISGNITVPDLKETDRVRIVQPVPTDPHFVENEIAAGNIKQEYEYTTTITYDSNGIEHTKFYFWVSGKTTKGNHVLSPSDARTHILQTPAPYVFFQGAKPSMVSTFDGGRTKLPVRFTQAIITGLRGIITDDNRYIVRWTRDHTLRDSLNTGDSHLHRKSLHEQWELIRPFQLTHIPRWLWDKVTESMIGYKLTNPLTRVPTHERELYDIENMTSTQFGLGQGQTFTNGPEAIQTIQSILTSSDIDFAPIDINAFFQTHSFDTPENIIESMDVIYNTFSYEHVNMLFFDLLLDAMAHNGKYEDIFKTSMIAVHGVRPFQVGGIFDD